VFSRRTGWRLEANDLYNQAAGRRAVGDLADLTVSNPTVCGFSYPPEIVAALASPAALVYEPQAFGLAPAREAVAEYYRARGVAIPPERLALTASTSEAYSHLFRLLCDGGDNVLMPTPSYPLFEMLAGVEEVGLRACPMVYDAGWHLDVEGLAALADERTRAVLLFIPTTPPGTTCNRTSGRRCSNWRRRVAGRWWWTKSFSTMPGPPRRRCRSPGRTARR